VIYFANPSTEAIRAAMAVGGGPLGAIVTPLQGNRVPPAPVRWCADNGCFGNGYPGDAAWLAWLADRAQHVERCAFATAPDVVGNAAATMGRSLPFLPQIRRMGFPAALVAQDGLESMRVPWPEFDVLFIGGSTGWKLSQHVVDLAHEARTRGTWVHVGRVNSEKRLRFARFIGADSIDGTYLRFSPDENLLRLLRYMRTVLNNEPLPLPLGGRHG
jgi:hypothetical protein